MQVSGSNHFYGFLDLCSLQKFMEILGPVVTWLLNATLIRSGHVFKKCKASQVASIRSVGISYDVLKVEINCLLRSRPSIDDVKDCSLSSNLPVDTRGTNPFIISFNLFTAY